MCKNKKSAKVEPLRAKHHSLITYKGFKKPTEKTGKKAMTYKDR
jgi:hypothetical protein